MTRLLLKTNTVGLPLVIGLAGVVILMVLVMLTRAVSQIQAEIAELRQRAATLTDASFRSPTKHSLAEVEKFLERWQRSQLTPDSVPELITTLGDSAQKNGLRLSRYVPKQWTTLSWLQSCDIRMELEGSSEGVLRWLTDFQQADYATVLRRFEIERINDHSSEVRCLLEFTGYSEKSD